MLEVNIEKIIPVTEARDMFNKIIDDVEGTDELYVLTKNGKPAAVVVGVNHLEKLTGQTTDSQVTASIDEKAKDPAVSQAASGPSDLTDTFAAGAGAEEAQTVFASADDVTPAVAESIPGQVADPFAMAASEIAAQNDGALTSPVAPLAESAFTPTAVSTETDSDVSNITPIPEGFNNDLPAPDEITDLYNSPAADGAATQAPEQTIFASDPAATTTFTTDPSASSAPAANPAQANPSDSSAGPILPPKQDI